MNHAIKTTKDRFKRQLDVFLKPTPYTRLIVTGRQFSLSNLGAIRSAPDIHVRSRHIKILALTFPLPTTPHVDLATLEMY